MTKKIAIIGTGYVGLVTGACFADSNNTVICVDSDVSKVDSLANGIVPIYEPGLERLVKKCLRRRTIKFTTDIKEAVRKSAVIFICVGTPPRPDGSADLSSIESVSCEIAKHLNSYKLIVEKSTVPVETGLWVKKTLKTFSERAGKKSKKPLFDIASNPEFLREGSAIHDFMNPDRIVVGVESERARRLLEKLYKPFRAPLVVTNIEGAELIKHASNSFLATKISFINAIANICERVGADVEDVARGIGLDKRITTNFLKAGAGFGGFCFPKDLSAFIYMAESVGYQFDLLKEVEKINEAQKDLVIKKVKSLLWNLPQKTIGVLGLSFKPNTDDIRFSPSIAIIERLLKEKCAVKAYDPCAAHKTREKLGENVTYTDSAYEAAEESDCLLVMTEWDEFKRLDLSKIKRLMRQPVIVDGRNLYNPEKMKKLGFTYVGIGRKV